MLDSNLTLEQVAEKWLELWFLLPRCGHKVEAGRAQGQAHNSRRPVGKALMIAVGVGIHPERGDMAILTFTETRAAKGEDDPGYLLGFTRTGEDGEDEAKLAAEIDIRDEWVRGTIVGVNQGRESYAHGRMVNGNVTPLTRLIDPWQLVYHNLTTGVTDAERFLLEQEERVIGKVAQ